VRIHEDTTARWNGFEGDLFVLLGGGVGRETRLQLLPPFLGAAAEASPLVLGDGQQRPRGRGEGAPARIVDRQTTISFAIDDVRGSILVEAADIAGGEIANAGLFVVPISFCSLLRPGRVSKRQGATNRGQML
jgi:hypothetical protein